MATKQQILAGMVLLGFTGVALAGEVNLVAPVYPGAVPDRHAGDVTVKVYLSHAPLNKVKAWYSTKVGPLTSSAGITLVNADQVNQNAGRTIGTTDAQLKQIQLGHVVMNQSKVVRSLKDMTRTKDIGVLCEGMVLTASSAKPSERNTTPPSSHSSKESDANAMLKQLDAMQNRLQRQGEREMNSMSSPAERKIAAMSDLFEGLRQEAMSGQHGHSKQQLLRVYAKYGHLERDWYPTVKTANGPESYDRWLLAKDKAKLGDNMRAGAAPAKQGAVDMQKLSARIQAAAAAGRMDEMQALSAQMQNAVQNQQTANHAGSKAVLKDHWQFWMNFLKNLDAHAYRTRIWVNTMPSKWGY